MCEFVHKVFAAEDLVEVRAIASWTAHGKKRSQVIDRFWCTATELSLPETLTRLRHANEEQQANIYFGCNPRERRGSNRVERIRCLWADVDAMKPAEVLPQLPTTLPAPSIVVDSGHGTHLYWRLEESFGIDTEASRVEVETLLRNLYRELGGDSVQNVERLLRLPGFWNRKNAKNGEAPTPCVVVGATNDCYPYSAFVRWVTPEPVRNETWGQWNWAGNKDFRTRQRIQGLLSYLEKEVDDRSKRDFGVVCGLLRLGVHPEEICTLVGDLSKFAGDEHYLRRTVDRAVKAIFGSP